MLILNSSRRILLNVQCDVAVAKTSLKSVRVVAVDLNRVVANDALTPPPCLPPSTQPSSRRLRCQLHR